VSVGGEEKKMDNEGRESFITGKGSRTGASVLCLMRRPNSFQERAAEGVDWLQQGAISESAPEIETWRLKWKWIALAHWATSQLGQQSQLVWF